MKIDCITEVAIAVHDLDDAIARLVEVFGATPGEIHEFPGYAMRFCMCRVGQIDFEMMAPTGDGVIARFLAKRGEGIHHIAFAVDDIGRVQRKLEGLGLKFANDEAQSAAYPVLDFAGRISTGTNSFAFVKPASFMGVLLEFVEYAPGFQLPAGATIEPKPSV
jgi:methylmalonyl-CoA/ethylmalonyl-CoA epimerase